MIKLTERQQRVFDHLRNTIEATGFPPTRAELAKELGFRSPNAAEEHLKALARKGMIEMLPGTSRGIRLVGADDSSQGLPIVGHVAAGEPILATEHIHDYCRISADFFRPQADFLLEVRGDSMKNIGILDGDFIAVHKTNIARNGQVIVARLGDEVTVKRYEKKRNQVTLFPENDDYEPIKIDLSQQEFNVEGLFVGVIRR